MVNREKQRKNRSDKYQHLYAERSINNEVLDLFSNADSIYKRLNPFEYNDELIDLYEELRVEFWKIVEAELTDRQKQVLRLTADGLTQTQIARQLNINQSSITKSINGNVDYRQEGKHTYGGIKKRVRFFMDQDPKVQKILARIAELQEQEW